MLKQTLVTSTLAQAIQKVEQLISKTPAGGVRTNNAELVV
jgi:hypothetical protein